MSVRHRNGRTRHPPFLAELDPRASRKSLPYAAGNALRFLLGNLYRMARGRWYRFGYACVNFGSPVSMREYCRSRGIDFRSMDREERCMRVEAAFLRNADRALSGLEVKAEVLRMIGALAAAGARVHIPRKDQDYAVDVGLRMLTLRRSCDTTRTRSGTCYGSPACMRSERVRSCYA